MADVLALAFAALLTLGGGIAVALIVRAGQRRRELAARDRPRRLRAELGEIDDIIRQVNQAAADEDLDRLEQQRKEQKRWDGLSSRSSSGWPRSYAPPAGSSPIRSTRPERSPSAGSPS